MEKDLIELTVFNLAELFLIVVVVVILALFAVAIGDYRRESKQNNR